MLILTQDYYKVETPLVGVNNLRICNNTRNLLMSHLYAFRMAGAVQSVQKLEASYWIYSQGASKFPWEFFD